MTVIATDRLTLTTLTREEAAAIRGLDRAGRRWADDYPSDGDAVVAAIVGEAGEHYDESAAYGILQVRLCDSGLAIGGIGFISPPDDSGTAEVGYGLAESARGQGFATEALEAVLVWAHGQGLRTMVAITAPDNVASQAVLIRCRFDAHGLVESGEGGTLMRWERLLQD